jgi:hypothetical protein
LCRHARNDRTGLKYQQINHTQRDCPGSRHRPSKKDGTPLLLRSLTSQHSDLRAEPRPTANTPCQPPGGACRCQHTRSVTRPGTTPRAPHYPNALTAEGNQQAPPPAPIPLRAQAGLALPKTSPGTLGAATSKPHPTENRRSHQERPSPPRIHPSSLNRQTRLRVRGSTPAPPRAPANNQPGRGFPCLSAHREQHPKNRVSPTPLSPRNRGALGPGSAP